MKMNDESALEVAIAIAKIVCEHSSNVYPNGPVAEDIAEFVDVLSDQLAGKSTTK